MFELRGNVGNELLAMLRLDIRGDICCDPFRHLVPRNFGAHQVRHQCAPLRPVERSDLVEADSEAPTAAVPALEPDRKRYRRPLRSPRDSMAPSSSRLVSQGRRVRSGTLPVPALMSAAESQDSGRAWRRVRTDALSAIYRPSWPVYRPKVTGSPNPCARRHCHRIMAGSMPAHRLVARLPRPAGPNATPVSTAGRESRRRSPPMPIGLTRYLNSTR
jgi:hypothetical protein